MVFILNFPVSDTSRYTLVIIFLYKKFFLVNNFFNKELLKAMCKLCHLSLFNNYKYGMYCSLNK